MKSNDTNKSNVWLALIIGCGIGIIIGLLLFFVCMKDMQEKIIDLRMDVANLQESNIIKLRSGSLCTQEGMGYYFIEPVELKVLVRELLCYLGLEAKWVSPKIESGGLKFFRSEEDWRILSFDGVWAD